jgi:glycerol kinase
LLFCTGTDIVYSNHGLLSTVRYYTRCQGQGIDIASQVAYRVGPKGKPVYALEGASKSDKCFPTVVRECSLFSQLPWPEVLSSGCATL